MKHNPLVSVLMTSYNREKYIGEAIESVLNQSYKNFELIIVDDCSSDKTVDIAKKYQLIDNRVKVYINDKNVGDYPNRNIAASYATGKYLKYLDSDDIMYSYCLDVMVNAMENYPEAAFGLSSIDEERTFPILITPSEIYKEAFFTDRNHFSRGPGSSIIRRDVFNEIGGFIEERHIGDTDMWLKLAQQFCMVKFQFSVYWNRIHPHTESNIENHNLVIKKIRKKLFFSYLKSENCPLSKTEIKKVIINFRRKRLFSFLYFIRKMV